MSETLTLIVRHIGRGRFVATLDGAELVTSRTPLLDGARALLARGADPATMPTMRGAECAYDSFVPAPIGRLAGLAVIERDRSGLSLEKWRPHSDESGSPHPHSQGRISAEPPAEGEAAETVRPRVAA